MIVNRITRMVEYIFIKRIKVPGTIKFLFKYGSLSIDVIHWQNQIKGVKDEFTNGGDFWWGFCFKQENPKSNAAS